MSYKWKPSKKQRKEFAIKMQDPAEKEAYEARKAAKAKKQESASKYDYESAGGMYIPTQAQHDYAVFDRSGCVTEEQEDACNQVAYGFSCQEKIPHDYIHIVNEMMRQNYKTKQNGN